MQGSAVSVGQCDLQLDLEQCKVSDSIFVIPDISPKDDLSQGEGTSSGTPDDADGMAGQIEMVLYLLAKTVHLC